MTTPTPTVVYEDEQFLVVNKPSGMTVNNADTTIHDYTLQNWLEQNYGSNYATDQGHDVSVAPDFYARCGIVHRLDKETSGILLVAKTPLAFIDLQRQFKERLIQKQYVALCHGKVIPAEGEVTVPVGRLVYNRKRFGVVAGGREAHTSYKTRKLYTLKKKSGDEILTLLDVYPKTGRTHQIRVHLTYLHHPIFADSLYAGRKTSNNDRHYLSRLFLHAYAISFAHPVSKEQITFSAPLSPELETFLESLLPVV